ncbi:MAG: amidoligase family protein [Clostridia bacterium]|nr:amidoligase family protein [Clostridia bacterium]
MNQAICNECGAEYSREDLTEFRGELYCEECLNSLTVICQHCGDRIWRHENEGTEDFPLCDSCRENHYTYCERCGQPVHNDRANYLSDDDDDPYCSSCYEMICHNAIKNYHYKPNPIFYGGGTRFFGVELEIDGAGEDTSSAEEILEVGNYKHDHIYCKHDGSLENGFEIVTHPMTLNYHTNSMPWEELLETARHLGYKSHQAETCGLHIHVNRSTFASSDADQESAIARILYFVEKNWNELLIFSRRTEYQLAKWAARYGYKDNPCEMKEHIKKGNRNRYTCVNLTNESTIEFRIFRGTLKLNTIIATLQLVNHICNVAISLSDEDIRRLSWSKFVSRVTEPELIQYLKERRLYINEPTESEEDI